MGLFDMTDGTVVPVARGHFGADDEARRDRLRTALRENIFVLGEELLVIAEEFGDDEWLGGRIGMLCLDRNAHPVVVEMKRAGNGGPMDLHGLRVAATVSKMSMDDVVGHLERQLAKVGDPNALDARRTLATWLSGVGGEAAVLHQDVRLILVLGDFDDESTKTALWLNDVFQMDVRCLRITPYQVGGRVLLDVEQVVPVPATKELVVQRGRTPRTPRSRSGRRRRGPWFVAAAMIVAAATLSLLVRVFVLAPFDVPSGSMLPTLQVGDRLFVDKLFYSVHRGDIVVFARAPGDTDLQYADLVKRVIGLPGETISSRGQTVYIDGRPLSEPWLPALQGVCRESSEGITKTTIGPGQYYVMGDCRGDSSDSRTWGTVPASNVIGTVTFVAWRHNHPWLHIF